MKTQEIIIHDTYRGLSYEDAILIDVLGAGRHPLPIRRPGRRRTWFWRRPKCEVVLVDLRARDLTIKGQEVLTSDKVAIRVGILVRFAVVDPTPAIHAVADYEDRLHSDVQLAARRSLTVMTLEEILTNRHRLSEEILRDVKEAATGYGVAISRADMKEFVFPGNLQVIMNRVLAAERTSQAQLVEARTKADAQRLQSQTEADAARLLSETRAESTQRAAEAEVKALATRADGARAYATHPALLRLEELATLRDLARNSNARLYLDFKALSHDEKEANEECPALPLRLVPPGNGGTGLPGGLERSTDVRASKPLPKWLRSASSWFP